MTIQTEKWLHDPISGVVKVKRSEDVSAHLDLVNHEKTMNPTGYSKDRNWRKIGSIPMSVVLQWKEEGVDVFDASPEGQKAVRRKLNEYTRLRTVDRMV